MWKPVKTKNRDLRPRLQPVLLTMTLSSLLAAGPAWAQSGSGAPSAPASPGQAPGAPSAPAAPGQTPGTPSATPGQGPGSPSATPGTPNNPGQATPGTPAPATGSNGQAPASGTQGTVGSPAQGSAPGQAAQSLPLPGLPAPAVYTLADTIHAALQSSSDLQIAQRNVEIDRKRADEAADAAKPNLGTSATGTYYDQATKIAFGTFPPVIAVPQHSETLAVTLTDRLDLTGQIRAATNQARLQSLADQFVVTQISNSRVLRAQTLFFNFLRAQHQVQVAQAALATSQTQLTNAEQLNAAQVGQKIDVYRAQTLVAQSQQNLNAAQNNLNIAQANFNDLVGQPLGRAVQAADVPGVTVGVDVQNNTAVGAPAPNLQTPFTAAPDEVSKIDIDQSLKTAYANRPEILADQVRVRAFQIGVKLARAGLEPTFSLDAGGEYYPDTSFQSPRQRVAQITATLTIPLYDGGLTRDRVKEAHLATDNAQTTLESQQSGVALDVRQAYLNLQTAAQQIDSANAALQEAIAARQLAQVRYAGQVGIFLEVTDAQSALVQAESSQVNAVYDYLVARATFENALGTPQGTNPGR